MTKIIVTEELARNTLDFIAALEGRSTPSHEGTLIARTGDDVSHLDYLPLDVVPEGRLLYFDEGADRAFVVFLEHCSEEGELH
jgi:hypothetical protein